MMIHAYDEMYLDTAMNNLGEAFDYVANTLKMDKDGKETHEFVNAIMEITQTKVTTPKENKEKNTETEVE